MGRVGLLASGGTASSGNIIAGHPEPHFVVAAGAAGGNSVTATVSAAFAVGFEAALVLQGGAVLAQLQAGDGRAAAGLLVSLSAGGAQLGRGWRVWFTNLRARLCQQGQWTLLGIQLQQIHIQINLCVYFSGFSRPKQRLHFQAFLVYCTVNTDHSGLLIQNELVIKHNNNV